MVIVEKQRTTNLLRREQSLTPPPGNLDTYIFARPHLDLANTLPPSEDNPLEQQRRRYMRTFIQDYPEAWRAWERGKLLEIEAGAQNIIEHSVVAAIFGFLLARGLGLPLQAQHDVALALVVHDADRLLEKKKLLDAAQKSKWSNQRRGIAPLLTGEHDFLEDIIADNDLISLSSANVPKRKEGWNDLRYQIVHYVDTILDGSIPQSPEERMKAGANSTGGRDPRVTQLRYKVHEDHLELPKGGYVTLQIDLANQEAVRFAEIINQRYGGNLIGKDLPKYLQELFDQEVLQLAA